MPGSTRKYSKSWLEFSRPRVFTRFATKASRFFWRSLSKTDCAIGSDVLVVYCAFTALVRVAAITLGSGDPAGGASEAIMVAAVRGAVGTPTICSNCSACQIRGSEEG